MNLIVEIDKSTVEPQTVINCICAACQNTVSQYTYEGGEEIFIPYHRKCPFCYNDFKEYYIVD
jgi:hypothetical protein